MPAQRELIAEFVRERHAFENEDSRVVIADAKSESGAPIVIKGEVSEGVFKAGLTYRFYGHTFTHHKYGEQFVFAAFTVEEPATEEAIVAYLTQCKGIGPSTARRLFDNYGANAIAALRLNPAKAADEVKGLKLEVAKEAAEFLAKFQSIERTKTELMGLMLGRGFPKKTIDAAIKKWGSDAAAIIRRCPYYLMSFRGCGFLKTDKMYLELGLPADRMKRQALCAWHAIARDSDGHTWFPLSNAVGAIRQRISGGQLNPAKATELAVRARMLVRRTHSDCEWIAEDKKAWAEERCANAVFAAEDETPSWPDLSSLADDRLSEHQIEELSKALGGVIGLLTGSPGTGKTFTAAAVIREIAKQQGDCAIAVCAPTGKAAVRLTEAMHANGIDIPAVTIHRLLQVESSSDGWSFYHGAANPLPFRFVIIDESSMIDTSLMASLLDARAAGTHYLFLGDPNQLAPVGHGAPLRDFIAAGVPCGELREIRRNSGRIVRACADIRDLRRFNPSPQFDPESGENLLHVESNAASVSIQMLQQFIQTIQGGGKYDPVWGVQVLCAVNKKSPLGRRDLNKFLQGLLNPAGKQASGNSFRQGDKIINLKNGWFPSLDPEHKEANDDGKVFVANGEIGEAVQVEPSRTICRLQSPERVLIIPHGAKGKASDSDENDDDKVGKENSENDEDTGTGSTWDLAYAISTHKSQGSEFPVVVVMIDDHAGAQRLCTRNWLYTAISRAKTLCITIGQKRLADAMCGKDGLRRRTFLVERLGELRGPIVPPPRAVSEAITDDAFSDLFAGVAS
jgi:exodeoxyribonuclease V alpha subunit